MGRETVGGRCFPLSTIVVHCTVECRVGKREVKRKENNLGLPSLLLLCPPFFAVRSFSPRFFFHEKRGKGFAKGQSKNPRLDFFSNPRQASKKHIQLKK